jgi:hypothetical protein
MPISKAQKQGLRSMMENITGERIQDAMFAAGRTKDSVRAFSKGIEEAAWTNSKGVPVR